MNPLKPIMAALLAASSFALPGTALASDAAPDAAHLQAVRDINVVLPRLIDILGHDAQARKDVGERLAKFVQGTGGDSQYFTDGLLKDKTLLPAAVAAAKDWPEKNKDKPGGIAALYFVVGPDALPLPSWAPPEFGDKFKPGLEWGGRLRDALKSAHWSDSSRVAQSDAANGTIAFLNDAAARAQKILDDVRTKKEVGDSADANDTTGTTPPIVRNPLDSTGAGFGFDDLYKNGAVVQDVWGAGDDGYRRISMKMYTVKVPPDNHLQNMIGIVDITPGDPATPYKPTFIPMTQSGDSSVSLRKGGRKYSLSIGMENGEHTVSFSRSGGHALTTSVERLSRARADQAASGGIVTIGGQKFYAIGQGGEHGSALFFPKEDIDNRASASDPRYLRPVAVGDVSRLDDDGLTVPMSGHPDMGTIDGKPYHLEFDHKTKMWEVKEGEGDKPVVPAPSTTTVNGETIPPGPAPTSGGKTLDQVVALAKAAGQDVSANDGFSAAALAKIRVVKHQEHGVDTYTVFFAPELGMGVSIDIPPSLSDGQNLVGARGFGDYIIFEYERSKQYLTIDHFLKWAHQEKVDLDANLDAKTGMQKVPSVDLALDMLTHYFTLSADQRAKLLDAKDGLRARVAAQDKGGGYLLSGNAEIVHFSQGSKSMEIWPKLVLPGDTGTNEKMTGLRGPGTAVDLVGGGPSQFLDDMSMPGNRTAHLVKKQEHAAIYTGDDTEIDPKGDAKTVKLWYLMIDYKKNENPARTKPLPVFGGRDRFSLPNGYEMQGLEGVTLPDTAQLMMLHGSTQEKGAIAAYRTALPDSQGGQNVKDKAGNCGGAVIWWGGETKEQAQKACETDSKIR